MKVDTEKAGRVRTIWIDGKTYHIIMRDKVNGQDQWQYILPDGQTYSHVTEFGALLMILKAHGGNEWAYEARTPS